MITRKRIKFSEKEAALIWQQAVGSKLNSTRNALVNVIYPGRTNGDNGPDFRDAVIGNKAHLVKGDVEVHVKSSDWYNHGHHTDINYNNVILHVVMWHDCNSATLLQNGKMVPVLCLAEALRHQARLLPYHLPCFQILNRMDIQSLKNLLNNAGEARFRLKAIHFRAELKQKEMGQVLFRGIMRALGYVKNTRPFEYLADRVPLNSIESQKGVALKQALLLGTAGLLASQRWQGEFAGKKEVQELEQLWRLMDRKIETMKEGDWNLSHIYPNNSPVRRIVALSYLLERYSETKLLTGILQLVKEAPQTGGHCVLKKGLTVTGDGYWWDHFDFDIRSKTRKSALLGNSKVSEIVVNVVLPFAFSWGELTNDAKITENALEFYRNYPKLSENYLIQHMKKQVGLEESFDLTACRQQGLIHIFKNYCCEGRCEQCPLVS
jgi:hypothetical protein